MIRTIFVGTCLSALCVLLQSTYLQAAALFGVVPDLALVVLVYIAVRNGTMEGQVVGFASGFALDVASSAPLGFNMVIRVTTGFVYGLFFGKFFIDAIFIPVILSVTAVLLKALQTNLLHLFFQSIPAYDFLDKDIWIQVAYTGIASPLIFLALNLLRSFTITEQNRI